MTHDFEATPADVIAFAWSAPMRDLAAKAGMSDVGLRKLLRGAGVEPPPQGHWNRVHAGRDVPAPPAPPPRAPGQWPLVRLDRRLAGLVPAAPDPDPAGPFASRLVPEDLAELRVAVLRATRPVKVARSLSRAHPGVAALLRREERLREKAAASEWLSTPGARFDDPFSQRRLRIANALLLAFAAHGGHGSVGVRDDDLEFGFSLRNSGASVHIDEPGRLRRGAARSRAIRPKDAMMAIRVASRWNDAGAETWTDDAGGKVEGRLAEVVAAVVTFAERGVRELAAERHAHRVQRLEAEVRMDRERAAETERRRTEELAALAAGLAEADRIRTLVARVTENAGDHVDPAAIDGWRAWALAHADRLDPLRNGRISAHIGPS